MNISVEFRSGERRLLIGEATSRRDSKPTVLEKICES